MRRRAIALAAAGAATVAAVGGAFAVQAGNEQGAALPMESSGKPDAAAPRPARPRQPDAEAPHDERAPDTRPETPMAERVAVLGLLNKRNGDSRDITLKPGQGVRVGDAVVRLRACETTGDWEPEQLTGAFVQLDTRNRQGQWKRVFSGWLYKESPSLNVVEDAVYDVWPKSCAMTRPDVGPSTELASAVARGGVAPRSSAKKSPDASEPAPAKPPGGAAEVPESASSNSAR